MADRNAGIVITLRNQADPEVRRLSASFGVLITQTRTAGATQEQAERQALAHAQALARLAVASGQAAQGERILTAALTQVDQESLAATRAQTQLVGIQQQVARGSQQGASLAGEFGSSLKSNLLGVIGPAALATAAIGTLKGTLDSFEQGFEFKAALDQTTASIQVQLKGVRDAGAVYLQAASFGDRYKFTQQEINQALQASVGILRQSRAGADDLLGVLARLQIASPEQGLEGAALAVKELQSGSITSLVGRFEVSRAAANKMKQEIQGGADAVQVLSKYLDDAGIGMDALKTRTEGAAGALNDAKRAAEQLAIAEGKFTAGPGVAITEAKTAGLLSLTAQLSGNFEKVNDANQVFVDTLTRTGSVTTALAARNDFLNTTLDSGHTALTAFVGGLNDQVLGLLKSADAGQVLATKILELNSEMQASAQASVQDAAQKQAQTLQTQLLKAQTDEAVRSFLALNPGIDASGIASEVAAGRISPLIGQLAALQVQANATAGELFRLQQAQVLTAAGVGARRPGRELQEGAGVGGAAKAFADNMAKGSDAAQSFAAEQGRIADAQTALDLARARTSAQRIAIYQRELAQTTDQAERLRILAQIESERNSGAKAHTSELGKQLSLEERIRDSKEAQLKAALDAQEAAIRDRQERRKEDQEARTAQRILASGRASQTFKDAAADALALIGVHQQQRQLDIANKLATAGGTIVGGRVLQSVPSGGTVAALPGPARAGAAVPTGAAPLAGGGIVPIVNVAVYVDGQQIAARVVLDARQGLSASRSGGGGIAS